MRCGVVGPAFAQHAQRHGSGGFDEDRLVQAGQCRQRRVRATRRAQAKSPLGAVEIRHHRIGHRTLAEHIECAAIPLRARRRLPVGGIGVVVVEHILRHRRNNARAAQLVCQQAGCSQGRCRERPPHRLGSAGREPAAVPWIAFEQLGGNRDDCLIDGARNDRADQVLRLQPWSMKSTASQSSSSRYSGTGARVPKSSAVSTRPVPKIACQI